MIKKIIFVRFSFRKHLIINSTFKFMVSQESSWSVFQALETFTTFKMATFKLQWESNNFSLQTPAVAARHQTFSSLFAINSLCSAFLLSDNQFQGFHLQVDHLSASSFITLSSLFVAVVSQLRLQRSELNYCISTAYLILNKFIINIHVFNTLSGNRYFGW